MREEAEPILSNYLRLSGGTMQGDINIGANKINTTDSLIKQGIANTIYFRNLVDTDFANIYAKQIDATGQIIGAGYYVKASGAYIRSYNVDNSYFTLQARDNGVAPVEVARLQSGADPYLQATLPLVLLPIATASLPATPVEGMIAYDATLNKLVVYTGAGWEAVTSV